MAQQRPSQCRSLQQSALTELTTLFSYIPKENLLCFISYFRIKNTNDFRIRTLLIFQGSGNERKITN